MVLIGSVYSGGQAYSESFGMSITATATEGSDTILVTGYTASKWIDITFTVISPDGFNRLAIDQVTSDVNGDFATIFELNPLWKQNGFYTITAMQRMQDNSLYTISVMVEVINGKTSETNVTESNLETGVHVPEHEQLALKGLVMRFIAINGSTTIEIEGQSDITNIEVTLKVIAPNGKVISVDKITPNLDGKFSKDITTGGPLWTQDGLYTVTVQQGESSVHKDSVNVEIVDGVVLSNQHVPDSETKEHGSSDAIITVKIQGDSIFYLDNQNQIIRAIVEIQNYTASDGQYLVKITHLSSQKVLKDFVINPRSFDEDLWIAQMSYPIQESDIKIGDQTLFGEYQIKVTSEFGRQTGSISFFILESSTTDEPYKNKIPDWVKNTMQWYLDGIISEDEMISAIQYLVKEGIIQLD